MLYAIAYTSEPNELRPPKGAVIDNDARREREARLVLAEPSPAEHAILDTNTASAETVERWLDDEDQILRWAPVSYETVDVMLRCICLGAEPVASDVVNQALDEGEIQEQLEGRDVFVIQATAKGTT